MLLSFFSCWDWKVYGPRTKTDDFPRLFKLPTTQASPTLYVNRLLQYNLYYKININVCSILATVPCNLEIYTLKLCAWCLTVYEMFLFFHLLVIFILYPAFFYFSSLSVVLIFLLTHFLFYALVSFVLFFILCILFKFSLLSTLYSGPFWQCHVFMKN